MLKIQFYQNTNYLSYAYYLFNNSEEVDDIRAIDVLMEDHRMIEDMVDLLDISVELVENGKKIPSSAMNKELDFCSDFINKYHEAKEEEILIPVLHRQGYPLDRGPIWETLEDHRKGRAILRRWLATKKMTKEDQRLDEFKKYAGAYSLYLYEHIKEEEKQLYNSANLALKEEMIEEIMRGISHFDKGLSEKGGKQKYEKMLSSLKNELK